MRWRWTTGLIFILTTTSVFGQIAVREYFDRQGVPCPPEGSYFFIEGKKNNYDFFYDTLRSFYSGSRQLRSVELRDQFGNRMGPSESYYENGLLRAETRFDKRFGRSQPADEDSVMFYILEFNDSTGGRLVKNGEGFVNGMLDFKREYGRVVNGLRDSVWTTFYDNGKVYCYESWHSGRFIDGISYDVNGNEYYYKRLNVVPTPVLGMQEFNDMVSKKMRYPKEAQRRGIQGKVMIELMIEKDGTMSSQKVLRGLGFGCDEEALKALASSTPWIACKLRGQSVAHSVIIPITFKLN